MSSPPDETPDNLLTRGEVLGGLPMRRARTLLFLIESRAAHLAARSRQALDEMFSEQDAREREQAYFEAFALGREPPIRPTIQDLERQAPRWRHLVPETPAIRAALAQLLAGKYAFPARDVPEIRAALGLDEAPVQRAYQRLFRRPLDSIYSPRLTPLDRLRWRWTALTRHLERLPPFWIAFFLTITFNTSQAFLALPIAVAGVGPLAGIGLIFLLGLLNIVTMACMAEAVSRNGSIRYGNAFLGRVVADYLGMAGSLILSLSVGIRYILGLLANYVGLSTTLAGSTGLPTVAWTPLLLLVGLWVLSRGSLNVTLSLMVGLGLANLGLLLCLALLALPHARPENLLYLEVPFVGGAPYNEAILQQIFGTVLIAYFGHVYVGQVARGVLPRDASARSLIWGSVAGMACMMVIFCFWVLAVGGAAQDLLLANQSGTALTPLANRLGAGAHVLAAVLVLLLLGMSTIRNQNVLFNLVRERLPSRQRLILLLPRGRGRLLLEPRGQSVSGPRLGLTYLGLVGGRPKLRLEAQLKDHAQCFETTVERRWEATELLNAVPWLRDERIRLVLEVLDADPDCLRLAVRSSLLTSYEGDWTAASFHLLDTLTLPDPQRQLLNRAVRDGGIDLTEAAAQLGGSERTARAVLDNLVQQDFLRVVHRNGTLRYQARLGARRGSRLPADVWEKLADSPSVPLDQRSDQHWTRLRSAARRIAELLLGERGRFLLATSPVILTALIAEWLLIINLASYTKPLSVAGVIIVSLLAGIFPVLLVAASRRKGELVPGLVLKLIGQRPVVVGIYLFYLAVLLAHGLIIWQNPIERAGALAAGLLILAATAAMLRQGEFQPRAVLELRQSEQAGGESLFAITANGRPATAEVRLGYPEGEQRLQSVGGPLPRFASLRYASFSLPPQGTPNLKVWVHRVTPEGDSQPLVALLEIPDQPAPHQFHLELSGGQVILRWADTHSARVTFPEPAA